MIAPYAYLNENNSRYQCALDCQAIDLWLSHAPSTHSDKHGTGAMAAVTIGDISQEAIVDFWRKKNYISP